MVVLVILGISISAIHLGPIWQFRNELTLCKFHFCLSSKEILGFHSCYPLPQSPFWQIVNVAGNFQKQDNIPRVFIVTKYCDFLATLF
jgi:hypothetical protein